MAKQWAIEVHDKANVRYVTDDDYTKPALFSLRREAQAEAESMNKLTKLDIWKVVEYDPRRMRQDDAQD